MQYLQSGDALAPVERFLVSHPAVAPVVLLIALVAYAASGPISRRLQRPRGLVALLLVAAAVPAALTLTPGPEPGYALRWCITDLRPVSDWGRGGEELANMVMLVPFGVLALVVLNRRGAVVAVLLASAFPFLAELLQYAVPRLGRTCETTDVALNLLGLLIGVVVGVPARRLVRRRRTATARA